MVREALHFEKSGLTSWTRPTRTHHNNVYCDAKLDDKHATAELIPFGELMSHLLYRPN